MVQQFLDLSAQFWVTPGDKSQAIKQLDASKMQTLLKLTNTWAVIQQGWVGEAEIHF